jgi:hypothetical protein
MKTGIHLLILLAIALVAGSAGCLDAWVEISGPAGNADVTPIPTQGGDIGYGSIDITSSPWGADVYIDGLYKGRTPLTAGNVPAGMHEIILSKEGYEDYKQNITVTSGKTFTFKKTLTVPKPDIHITVTATNTGYRPPKCYWEVSGTVTNSGAGVAHDLVLTLDLDPVDDDYDSASTEKRLGYLNPGETRDFYIWVDAASCSDYTGSLEYVYYDEEDVKHSGTAKSI